MNRQIKFRGLRTDGKGWVYGCFFGVNKIVETTISNDRIYTDKGSDCFKYTYHEVMPETVGQFTGLLDENGVEIYEGDEFKDVRSHGDYSDDTFVVTFKDGKFGFYNYGIFDDRFDCESIEVIGNIHENNK